MAQEWHYAKNGEKAGPLSYSDLEALAKSGELFPTDLVWKKGMSQWVQASEVKDLFEKDEYVAETPPLLPTERTLITQQLSALFKVPRNEVQQVASEFYWRTQEVGALVRKEYSIAYGKKFTANPITIVVKCPYCNEVKNKLAHSWHAAREHSERCPACWHKFQLRIQGSLIPLSRLGNDHI